MFDDRLRNARQRLGYTQRQVAEKAQINIASYSAYENDKSIPPLDIALRIADALQVSLEALCGKKKPSDKLKTLGDVARCIASLDTRDDSCGVKTDVRCDPYDGDHCYVSIELENEDLFKFFEKRNRLLQMVKRDDNDLIEMFDTWQNSEFKRLDALGNDDLPF